MEFGRMSDLPARMMLDGPWIVAWSGARARGAWKVVEGTGQIDWWLRAREGLLGKRTSSRDLCAGEGSRRAGGSGRVRSECERWAGGGEGGSSGSSSQRLRTGAGVVCRRANLVSRVLKMAREGRGGRSDGRTTGGAEGGGREGLAVSMNSACKTRESVNRRDKIRQYRVSYLWVGAAALKRTHHKRTREGQGGGRAEGCAAAFARFSPEGVIEISYVKRLFWTVPP